MLTLYVTLEKPIFVIFLLLGNKKAVGAQIKPLYLTILETQMLREQQKCLSSSGKENIRDEIFLRIEFFCIGYGKWP